MLIIAEAGVNHNGQEQLAFELVDVAKAAGADVVKFQTFKAEKLATATAKRAQYQFKNDQRIQTQLEMLSDLELSYDCFRKISQYCTSQKIEFMSTAFDSDSLKFLVNECGQRRLKIPSGDLTNSPFILEHAQSGLDLIVSTGMATLSEIEEALGVIAYGMVAEPSSRPSRAAFAEAFASKEARAVLKNKVTLLHCTTEYPAPIQEINLRAIRSLEKAFGLPCGYSDHTEGIVVPIAAAAMGAEIIEKHFTLDRNMQGPDHRASLEPSQLAQMVGAIREIEVALGDGVKCPTPSELQNKPVARKSLVAARPIKMGTVITAEDLAIMRPGNGCNPNRYWDVIGTCADRNYQEHESID